MGVGAVVLVLVLPGFGYPYLFDDFDLLVRVLRFTPSDLLPDPGSVFYRPVSREIYFGTLQALSPHSALLGHLLNAAIVLTACVLCGKIASRFLGARGGLIASLLFAGTGQMPLLVAWVSGSQDALAICFTLAAVFFEVRGRHLLGIGMMALAILSKETAVSAIPAVALASCVLRESGRWWRRPLGYALLVIAWIAIHPGFHLLLARGFRSRGVEYVGIDHSNTLSSVAGYFSLLLNLPPPAMRAVWPGELTTAAVVALALTLWLLSNSPLTPRPEKPLGRFLLVASSLVLGPLLLTSVVLRNFAPYYAVFPAAGAAWLLAAWMARLPRRAQTGLVSVFLVAGIWMRGLVVDPGIPTEVNLKLAAAALRRLEPQFRALQPSMTSDAQVLIASQVRGAASVHVHLYGFQVFRQWYGSEGISVVRPELRTVGHSAEYLFWINHDWNVFQVDLASMLPRSVTVPARMSEYQGVVRAYSRGLAESDELDRAVQILLSMPEPSEAYRWADRRIAASYLMAFGREAEARSLLIDAPPIDRMASIGAATELVSQPTKVPRYDRATMEAFGLSWDAPVDVQEVAERLASTKNGAGPRFATRLLRLRPGDPVATAILRAYKRSIPKERIIPAQPLPK